MRIEIEVPKEFESDYNANKFKDFFGRVITDATYNDGVCGLYELETAGMLQKAFAESKVAYDVESVVAELEKKSEEYNEKADRHTVYEDYFTRYFSIAKGIDIAIEIVRGKE